LFSVPAAIGVNPQLIADDVCAFETGSDLLLFGAAIRAARAVRMAPAFSGIDDPRAGEAKRA